MRLFNGFPVQTIYYDFLSVPKIRKQTVKKVLIAIMELKLALVVCRADPTSVVNVLARFGTCFFGLPLAL